MRPSVISLWVALASARAIENDIEDCIVKVMYCPNCGNKNSADQRFCRSCGLGLEKIAQSLTEQLPTRLDKSLQERKEKLERLGVAALSVFGVGILSFILYMVFNKLMTQGSILAVLGMLALVIVLGCGLLSVILFAKAGELKESSAKRQIKGPSELEPSETKELLPDTHPEPILSVTERTTELLFAEKKNKTEEK